MRKFILIAATVLVSATAQAGETRGLTLASNNEPAAVQQSKAEEAPKATEVANPAEAPQCVERPAAVDTTTPAPNADRAGPVVEKDIQTPKAAKPRHRRDWTEARIIGELHRHGIYW
jgi:hypothetical protein